MEGGFKKQGKAPRYTAPPPPPPALGVFFQEIFLFSYTNISKSGIILHNLFSSQFTFLKNLIRRDYFFRLNTVTCFLWVGESEILLTSGVVFPKDKH